MTDNPLRPIKMPRRPVLAAGGAVVAGGLAALGAGERVEASPKVRRFGGAYYVQAEAPYVPHLMTFHDDGTMLSTNPTNVQSVVALETDAGSILGAQLLGTTDSVGMGTWRWDDRNHVLITMVQENANQPERTRGARLHVSARVRVYPGGDEFDGPAIAELLVMQEQGPRVVKVEGAVRSHLTGWRLPERFDQLSREDRRWLWQ